MSGPQVWFCPLCGTENAVERARCLACTSERPTRVEAARHAVTSAPVAPAASNEVPAAPAAVLVAGPFSRAEDSADASAVESLRSQVKVAGVLAVILGVMWLLGSAFFWTMGLLDSAGLLDPSTPEDQEVGLAVGIGGGSGAAVEGVASILAGVGYIRRRPWGRVAGIVGGILNVVSCGCIPAMGMGIWVLYLAMNSRAPRVFSAGVVSRA